MKNKWIRCIASGLLVCSMALSMVACGDNGDVDSNKEETKFENNHEPVVEPNTSEANVTLMKSSDTLVPTAAEELFKIDAPTADICGTQGSTTDGKYWYQGFYRRDDGSNQANNDCMILKVDMETGKVVAQSEIMQLNHINDITYNSRLGYLVVCHNAPFANVISYVDAETLTLVDTFAIDYFIYSINYSAERDMYVAGNSNSQTFRIMDADFKMVGEIIEPTSRTASCTTQGGAVDDDFIYFTLYFPNVISVYDWDGNFVTLIELEEAIPTNLYETESMTVLNGEIYVGCAWKNNDKSIAFKLSGLVPKPQVEQ